MPPNAISIMPVVLVAGVVVGCVVAVVVDGDGVGDALSSAAGEVVELLLSGVVGEAASFGGDVTVMVRLMMMAARSGSTLTWSWLGLLRMLRGVASDWRASITSSISII